MVYLPSKAPPELVRLTSADGLDLSDVSGHERFWRRGRVLALAGGAAARSAPATRARRERPANKSMRLLRRDACGSGNRSARDS